MPLQLSALPIKQKWKSDSKQWDFPVIFVCFCWLVLQSLWALPHRGPCLLPFVSVSKECVQLSKRIGYGGLRHALRGTADSELYFFIELLGHYYGAWSEQCGPLFTGRQLESSLIDTISRSMGQRGDNGVIDHLSGNQSMQLLIKLSFIVPELSGWSVLEWSM